MATTTAAPHTLANEPLDTEHYIRIKGARVHNLKDISITIPKNQLVVFTGVSGSGKSSLCIDTLYAEGQRRYVESLSSYARQFLTRMDKPDVDYIEGLCPAIAIEQKVTTRTTRSTVGTLTEIYDYLRLFFARAGETFSPKTGNKVKKHEVADVVDYVFSLPEDSRIQIFYPFKLRDKVINELKLLMQKGYTRIQEEAGAKPERIEDIIEKTKLKKGDEIRVLVDRVTAERSDENRSRVADSVNTAFFESLGDCYVDAVGEGEKYFNNRFELDGMSFEEPSPHLFNFNNPYGACPKCEGFGSIIGIDEDLVIPDKNLSVYDGAVAAWRGEKMKTWQNKLIKASGDFDFPIHKPIKQLTPEQYELLWTGNKHFWGLNEFFAHLEEKSYKIQYRVLLSRYRGRTKCTECKGARLRKDANYVKIDGTSISDLLLTPVEKVQQFFQNLELTEYQQEVSKRVLTEIENRLQVMMDVGLGYLTLNRRSNTLSGGETQRINLTRSLGSNLTSSMYILDEPSIGLHPKDTDRLIKVLKSLRDLGNTVLVVEHDEDIIKAADYIVDMGPLAGRFGGEVVFAGPSNEITGDENSLTAKYMTGVEEIAMPKVRRKTSNFIQLNGCIQHNLKDFDVKFPLNSLAVVTGVSGSGKTTMVKQILYPALKRQLEGFGDKPGNFGGMTGDFDRIRQVEMIDQSPLGRSSRSNPVTYIKAYDAIREFYSKLHLSKVRGYKPKTFSFNVEGGRCEVCKGEGEVVVEMQFLADVHLRCEECNGRRFKEDVLEVTYNDKNIFDVLEMSVDEAIEFFEKHTDIKERLMPLQDIGLGYVKLGQSSSTLSGGEAQRVKLASFLSKGGSTQPILFIFDEPTTGLHFHDIKKLLHGFERLIDMGHSIVVIEHNPDVMKCADWLIDLGPEGGERGGKLLYQGPPEGVLDVEESFTADYLREKLQ